MKNDTNRKLNEALDLMKSEVKDVFVDELHTSIDRAIEKAKGEAKAHVESAIKLDISEKELLSKLLVDILKRAVDIVYTVKPGLLAGLRVQVGDWKLDGTMIHQLEKMKSEIGGSSV